MEIETKSWLHDILTAINEINSFLDDAADFTTYGNDLKTKRAVERNFEIIGEAMNRILKKETSIQFSNSRKIVDIRNRITHGYDTVSDETIWGVIINYLPTLKQEIEHLLSA